MKDETIYTGRAIRSGNFVTLKFDTEEGQRLWDQRKLNYVEVADWNGDGGFPPERGDSR